jgi:hypothetical protein
MEGDGSAEALGSETESGESGRRSIVNWEPGTQLHLEVRISHGVSSNAF